MNAVATIRKPTKLEQFIGEVLPADQRDDFYRVLPKHISPERFERAVANVLMNTPEMMGCDPRLIFREISKVVGLGLMLDPQLGEAYLIMGWNGKTRQKEPQVRIGYKGLIKLAKQSGEILNLYAREVHKEDEIECIQGDQNRLIHKPKLFTDRGPIVGYYAAVQYRSGAFDFEPMSVEQIHAIRDRSDGWKAYADGKIKSTPWSTDEVEMAKKTVLRRLQKRLSQSPELNDAISIEDKAEFSAFDRGGPPVPRVSLREDPRLIDHDGPPPAPPVPQIIETTERNAPAPVQDAEATGMSGDGQASASDQDSDVVTMDSLLGELDDKLGYQATAEAIEEAYTDFDAEALLSDYPGGVEAGRKLKAQHLDRVGPEKSAGELSGGFPGDEHITKAIGPDASRDPFAIPSEFKGGGHYIAWINDALTATKTPDDAEKLKVLWAKTADARKSLVDGGTMDKAEPSRLRDLVKDALKHVEASERARLAEASDGAAEPTSAASDDPVASYTAAQDKALSECRTKGDVDAFWFGHADVRDASGAAEPQRIAWKSAMQRRKAELAAMETAS